MPSRIAAVILTIAVPLTAGCASKMGVDMRAGAAAPELQQIAAAAYDDDPVAQLALADRYARGDGVKRDPVRARLLRRQARYRLSSALTPNVQNAILAARYSGFGFVNANGRAAVSQPAGVPPLGSRDRPAAQP